VAPEPALPLAPAELPALPPPLGQLPALPPAPPEPPELPLLPPSPPVPVDATLPSSALHAPSTTNSTTAPNGFIRTVYRRAWLEETREMSRACDRVMDLYAIVVF
jgi:hypothetical protein